VVGPTAFAPVLNIVSAAALHYLFGLRVGSWSIELKKWFVIIGET